jgi:CBS domain-containing protein
MKVSEIMTKVIVVDSDIIMNEATKIMAEKKIGCLLVMEKDDVVGIITERDITGHTKDLNKKVREFMSKKVITIEPDESLERAAEIMRENSIKKLPVAKEDKLLGIVTSTDLIENSESLNEDFFFND